MTRTASSPAGTWWAAWAVLAVLASGCNSRQGPVYQGSQGFRFTPPPGWVERARDDAMPVRSGRRPADLPMPKLAGPGERLLVRYDRLTSGRLAWVRVSVADVPPAGSLQAFVAAHAPGPTWKPEGEAENLEVSGLPAARAAFGGRWSNQDYVSETVAVRHGDQVYLITASFPASDQTAREQVREAVAGATWQ